VILACEYARLERTSVVPALLDTAKQHGQHDTALFDAGYWPARSSPDA